MARTFGFVVGLTVAVVVAAPAAADVGLYPVTKNVPVGGVIAGHGDGAGMPAYLVRAAAAPRRHRCHGNGICEPRVRADPQPPFILLGRLRRTDNVYATQSFAFRLPAAVTPGPYRLYLYCRACGGTLIQSGHRINGETIRVTARPQPRTLRVRRRPDRQRFLISEPAGAILLLRLTVPHGTDAVAAASIPGLAGVRITTATANCRRVRTVDVCTQPEESCPMPAAAWQFELRTKSGPPGRIRIDFVIGRLRP